MPSPRSLQELWGSGGRAISHLERKLQKSAQNNGLPLSRSPFLVLELHYNRLDINPENSIQCNTTEPPKKSFTDEVLSKRYGQGLASTF